MYRDSLKISNMKCSSAREGLMLQIISESDVSSQTWDAMRSSNWRLDREICGDSVKVNQFSAL